MLPFIAFKEYNAHIATYYTFFQPRMRLVNPLGKRLIFSL